MDPIFKDSQYFQIISLPTIMLQEMFLHGNFLCYMQKPNDLYLNYSNPVYVLATYFSNLEVKQKTFR